MPLNNYNYPIVSTILDSFQEFKDEWSLVTFCYSCNFNCPFCYNKRMFSNESYIIGDFEEVFSKKINTCHTAVVFLGGEPTVWGEGLLKSLEFVKNKKLKTKCFTNGYRSDVIDIACSSGLLDAISIDFKALEDINTVCGINVENVYSSRLHESICSAISNNVSVELRTTMCQTKEQTDKLSLYISKTYPGIQHIRQELFSYG